MLKYCVVLLFGAITLQCNENLLEACLSHLILNNVSENETILFVNTNARSGSQLKMYYNISEEINSIITTPKPDVYIISNNITESLNVMNDNYLLDNNGKFIFIVNQLEEKLLNTIERYFVSKIVFIITTNDKQEFSNKHHKVILLNDCLVNKHLNIFNGTYLETTNELKLLYTATKPYSMSPKEGILVEFLNTVLNHMKIRFKYFMSSLPKSSINLPPEVESRGFDIYASFIPQKLSSIRFFQFSSPILDDHSVLVVPNIEAYDYFKLFYAEFYTKVWCAIIVVLITVYLVFYAIIYLLPSRNFSVLMLILSVIFEGVTSVRNANRSFRILLLNYLLFGLIITNVYKSKMFDLLRRDFHYELVKNEEDIMKNRLKFGINSIQVLHNLETWFPPTVNLTAENLVFFCKHYDECVNRTLYEKDVVTISLIRSIHYDFFTVFEDANKKPMAHFIPTQSTQVYVPVYFLKGHPLYQKINRKLSVAKASGFAEFIYQKYSRAYKKIVGLRKDKISKTSQLTMNSLKSTFGLYLVCVVFSTIVFTLELIIYKIK